MIANAGEPVIVCFDLGGVLVRICRGWVEACQHAGLPVRGGADRLHEEPLRSRILPLIDGFQRGDMDADEFFAAVAAGLDGVYSLDEVERIHHAWTQEEFADTARLLHDLAQRPNITTACLSNTNHLHWHRLSGADGRGEYPSLQQLDLQLASHELRVTKPDTRIYKLADEAFGVTKADRSRVIFFDDLPDNVAAAAAHGWRAFHVNPLGNPPGEIRETLRAPGIL